MQCADTLELKARLFGKSAQQDRAYALEAQEASGLAAPGARRSRRSVTPRVPLKVVAGNDPAEHGPRRRRELLP